MMLEDASIKLSSVASSLTTVSARAMLAAMIEGERDPLALAQQVDLMLPGRALHGDHRVELDQRLLHQVQPAEDRGAICAWWSSKFPSSAWAGPGSCCASVPSRAADDPGVGEKIAQVIVAETGADMSQFPRRPRPARAEAVIRKHIA